MPPEHWPSSAAASSGCRSRAGPRWTAGRCGCTAATRSGASWVAGGMLAPHSEGWPGEERLLRLGLESLELWHEGFLDGLPADVVTARESLVVAVDRADAADLKTVGEWLAAQGHPSR